MYGVWSWGSKTKRKTNEDLERGCTRGLSARKMNKVGAIDRCIWRKMIQDVRWSGWVWVGECFFWYRPTRVVPDQGPLNGCVCVCVCVKSTMSGGVLVWLSVWSEVHMVQLMPLSLTVSCFSEIQIGFTFLVSAHLGSTGQSTVKWMCVCVCEIDKWMRVVTKYSVADCRGSS